MERFMLPCLNKQLFGIDCLGCGLQRSLLLLFQGEFHAAFVLYQAIYTLLLLLFFVLFSSFRKIKNDLNIKLGLIIINAMIVIVSYGYKMQHILEAT